MREGCAAEVGAVLLGLRGRGRCEDGGGRSSEAATVQRIVLSQETTAVGMGDATCLSASEAGAPENDCAQACDAHQIKRRAMLRAGAARGS